ncbi:MAG: helix-turn-helix domain-containing protein [Pseudomonadota bacterium]
MIDGKNTDDMQKVATKTKKRFSPEVRRSMILDSAAQLIATDGMSTLSMEAIGQKADVSKSLMYKYFDSLQELLKELLERELTIRWKRQVAAAEEATTFEELVRGTTHVYLSFIAERGLFVEPLLADPSIAKLYHPARYNRKVAVKYFSDLVIKNFDMPPEIARAVTDISLGIPMAAGEFLLRSDMDLKELEDLTVSMMIGTYTMARFDYFTRKKKLER